MATTSSGDGASPARPIYPEEVGPARPLPPNHEAALSSVETELAAAQSDADAAILSMLAPVETELAAARGDVDAAIASAIGAIDSELRAAATPSVKAFDKVTTDTLRGLAAAEYDMRSAGIPIPYSPEQIALDLADDTGEAMLARLMGTPAEPITPPMPVEDDTDEPERTTLPVSPPPPSPPVPPVSGGAGLPVVPPGLPSPPAPSVPPSSPPPAIPPVVPGASPLPPPGVTCDPGFTWMPDLGICYRPPLVPPTPPVDLEAPSSPLPSPPASCDCPPPGPPVGPTTEPDVPPVQSIDLPSYTVRWWERDICSQMDRALDVKPPVPEPESGESGTNSRLGYYGDLLLRGGRAAFDAVKGLVTNDPALQFLAGRIAGQTAQWFAGVTLADPLLTALAPVGVPNTQEVAIVATKLGIADRAELFSGIPMSYLLTTERYLMQASAAQIIPTQPVLDASYLRNTITLDQWTCLTRAHGNIPECWLWAVDAQARRPDIQEVIHLNMRGYFAERGYYEGRLRSLGILDSRHIEEWEELARYIPTAPDLVRFGVRDVFDEAAVKLGGFDADFERKYPFAPADGRPNKLVEWARANGITEDTLRLYWRAHWNIPSNTQLFEMLHRLRVDRPEYQAFLAAHDDWTATGRVGPEPQPPLVATYEDVRAAIAINDVAPAFIDRIMATSYLPMNRTDAISAYMAGLMDAPELYQRFRDNGYDEPTARRMVQIQEFMRSRRTANVTGVWSIRRICNAYRAGTIRSVEADALLQPLIVDPDQRLAVISGTDQERISGVRAAQIKRIRRAYIVGEWDAGAVMKALDGVPVDTGVSVQLIDTWTAERDGRYKEITARNLIQWMQYGVITPDDALARFVRLGYTQSDAERFVYVGWQVRGDRVQGQIDKAQGKIEKYIKSQKQAAKEMQADLEKRQKEIEKMQKQLQDEADRIQKELEKRAPQG